MESEDSSSNINILLVISSLSPGGAEKSGIKLATKLSEYSTINVSLAILNPKLMPVVYSVPSNVSLFDASHIVLSHHKFRNSIPEFLVKKYKRIKWWLIFRQFVQTKNINLVISFGAETGCKVYIGLLRTRVRQLNCERNELHPSIHPQTSLERLLRPYIYKHGVACSVQTEQMKSEALELWGVDAFLTPNFYDIPRQISKPRFREPSNSLKFIFVGNESYQKNIELLISTWKCINAEFHATLTVYGLWTSHARSQLNNTNVLFCAPRPDLELIYSNYDVLISTSRFEGFPNVISEAILHGLQVISTPSTDQLSIWSEKFECYVSSSHSLQEFEKFALDTVRSIQKSPMRNSPWQVLHDTFSWETNKDFWFEAIYNSLTKD